MSLHTISAPIRLNQYSTSNSLDMQVTTSEGSSFDADIFGPSFWFTLHNGAAAYPEYPNYVAQQTMMHFLLGIPMMIPCTQCREHAYTYIRDGADLNSVVKSKKSLFEYMTMFHNYVNNRYGKRMMTLQDAKEKYGFYNAKGSRIRITYN